MARDLLTGHYDERSGYRTVRREGVADWLLIATVAGRGRFGHASGDLISEACDWVLLRPGTAHDYGVAATAKRWELLWAHFRPRAHWLQLLNWPAVAPGLGKLTIRDASTMACFREVHQLFSSELRRSEDFAVNAFETLLLHCDRQNSLAGASSYDERVGRAMDYLERNLAQKISLIDVAQAVGLSGSRLAHLFREQTGQTPQRYLEELRMRRATELLRRTGFSVKQIAAAVGFDSQFYFSQRFKAKTNQSPSSFRAHATEDSPRRKAGR